MLKSACYILKHADLFMVFLIDRTQAGNESRFFIFLFLIITLPYSGCSSSKFNLTLTCCKPLPIAGAAFLTLYSNSGFISTAISKLETEVFNDLRSQNKQF